LPAATKDLLLGYNDPNRISILFADNLARVERDDERIMADFKTFEVKQVGPVTLIQPRELEIVGRNLINDLADDLIEYVRKEKPTNIVVSLKRVTRYSSEAIGGLIRMERRVRSEGGRVKLCMNDELRDLFKVTRLDGTLFEIFSSESDAVASFFEKGKDLFGA
jgi:anti-sigma B factor antagonist